MLFHGLNGEVSAVLNTEDVTMVQWHVYVYINIYILIFTRSIIAHIHRYYISRLYPYMYSTYPCFYMYKSMYVYIYIYTKKTYSS